MDPSQPAGDTGGKVLRIMGIVLLALVALCGIVGTCVLLVTMVLPAFNQ
jgi:hypothetical protein